LPRRDLVEINNEKEFLDFMAWQLGVLLLIMRVFLATSRSKLRDEISFVDRYFYHRNLPSNPSFLENYKKVLRDTYDPYRTQYQVAKGFSFANYIDLKNRNSPYDKITEIPEDSGYSSSFYTPPQSLESDLVPPPPPPPIQQTQYQPPPPPPLPLPQTQYQPPSNLKKQLQSLTVVQLKQRARELGCSGYYGLKKVELIDFVIKCINKRPQPQNQNLPVFPLPQVQKPQPQRKQLQLLTVVQLKQRARELGCSGYSGLKKDELIEFLLNCIRKKKN
jgi:hypothetical protein